MSPEALLGCTERTEREEEVLSGVVKVRPFLKHALHRRPGQELDSPSHLFQRRAHTQFALLRRVESSFPRSAGSLAKGFCFPRGKGSGRAQSACPG